MKRRKIRLSDSALISEVRYVLSQNSLKSRFKWMRFEYQDSLLKNRLVVVWKMSKFLNHVMFDVYI